MSEDIYQIRFSGNVIDGYERTDVITKLSELFGIEQQRAEGLLNNRPSVMRKAYDLSAAKRLCERLTEIGVECRIVESKPEGTDHGPTPPQPDSNKSTVAQKNTPRNSVLANSDIGQALNGQYSFAIGKTITEAWHLISGHKWPIWVGLIALMAITLSVEFLVSLLGFDSQTPIQQGANPSGLGIGLLSWVLQVFLCTPIGAGLTLYCARVASGKQVQLGDIFSLYPSILSLGAVQIALNLLVLIGFLLLIVPGIYLSIAYALALLIQADRNLGVWKSLEASRLAITHRWFSVFGLFILLSILAMISALPFGIGLIWTLPMLIMAIGIMYRDMLGVESASS